MLVSSSETKRGQTGGQPGVKPGSTRGRTGVKLGSPCTALPPGRELERSVGRSRRGDVDISGAGTGTSTGTVTVSCEFAAGGRNARRGGTAARAGSLRLFSPAAPSRSTASAQGLTLVHFLAQRKRFLCDRGCIWELFQGCLAGGRGEYGVCRVYFVSERAQVELKSGRVSPCLRAAQAPDGRDWWIVFATS